MKSAKTSARVFSLRTSKKELADISLYDHMKMTAAVASCVMQFLTAKGEKNYKQSLFINAEKSYDEEMFLLYSMDISGIQSCISVIPSGQTSMKKICTRQ